MRKKPCTHEYLAATESARVLICKECGIVHLHIQNLAMRLEVREFLGLADTLTEAANRVRVDEKEKTRHQEFNVLKSAYRLN